MHRLTALLLGLALVVAACGDDASTTTTSGPTSTLDAAGVTAEVEDLITAAEDVRGLQFIGEPTITIVDEQELADRLRTEIDADLDPEDLAVGQRLYEILGLLDGTVDLRQAYLDLYAEQVGGYYDHDTGEMVIMGGSELSPLSKSIVVHELVHALTDAHYDFASYVDQLFDDERFEEVNAIQGLAEGDATYFQLLYLQTLPMEDQVAAVQESLDTDTTVMDSLPEWMGEDLSFPYDYGFGFVQRLIDEGDIARVNQAYEHFPTTTEQILHPEKYSIEEGGRDVELAAFDLPGYTAFEEGVFGEWNTRLYLLDGVDPGEALVSAAGWGGDRYRIYWDGPCADPEDCHPQVAFVYRFEGDTPRDAEELASSLALSAHNIMKVGSASTDANGITTYSGGPDFAYVALQGQTVLFIAADEPAAGQALVAAFGA